MIMLSSTTGYGKVFNLNVGGIAEQIRLLLIDNNIDYDDVPCEKEKWETEMKQKMPFKTMPCLYDGDLEVGQSTAILRHLGRKYGLYGDNVEEAARIDCMGDFLMDIRLMYYFMVYMDNAPGEDAFFPAVSEKLKIVESMLTDDYVAGKKVSWVDYSYFDFLCLMTDIRSSCLDSFPKIKAYKDRMAARQGVQKRLNSSAYKNLPRNNKK